VLLLVIDQDDEIATVVVKRIDTHMILPTGEQTLKSSNAPDAKVTAPNTLPTLPVPATPPSYDASVAVR
jgi:hypothetical protein